MFIVVFILPNTNESASIVVVFEAISNSRFIKSVKNARCGSRSKDDKTLLLVFGVLLRNSRLLMSIQKTSTKQKIFFTHKIDDIIIYAG